MTTTTPWSDTPPSEAGEWWVRRRSDGSSMRLILLQDGYWITSPYMVKSGRVAEQFQFGPRVLSAEETVKLTAERDEAFALVEEYHRAINPRRGELINRKIARVATESELVEFERLQTLTGRMTRLVAPLPIAELEAHIRRLKGEGKWAAVETLTVDDLDELERYRSPLGAGLGLDGKPIG